MSISPISTEAAFDGKFNITAGQKRKDAPNPAGKKPVKKVKRVGPRSDSVTPSGDNDKDGDASSRPKRVRTGCLTCRERHLKCDEAMPECLNCKKSSRSCKRGVRLNFIDTIVKRPPHILTLFGTVQWQVSFEDESREIASEYEGGSERYPSLKQLMPFDASLSTTMPDPSLGFSYQTAAPSQQDDSMLLPLPPIQSTPPGQYSGPEQTSAMHVYNKPDMHQFQQMEYPLPGTSQHSHESADSVGRNSVASYQTLDADGLQQSQEKKQYLDSQEETLFMQVFVDEVGSWMDSMDPHKHFSRLLPFHALNEPMLLNAFLACGARHLTLVNPAYPEEKALKYYDTATRFLLNQLENPHRNSTICAITAVILNVYEIMSERKEQRMNHIAGARALIKECGWNARSEGIGSACFWLNVGLEVLSCLHFNWIVAWNPDEWGIDMDFKPENRSGREELWTHRMLYIIAKICDFRATVPKNRDPQSQEYQNVLQQRHAQWLRLKDMCDAWNESIPRTMHPMAYLHPFQTTSKSCFPEVWLIKRSTIVARLFYHTAMLLLAQTHPYYNPNNNQEMEDLQTLHSRMICGIAAHVQDRGVASVAIRSLAHAAEVLTDRKEQDEVLRIFSKINKDTGWRIGFVYELLMEKWGWNEQLSPMQYAQTHTGAQEAQKLARQQSVHIPLGPSIQLQQAYETSSNGQSLASAMEQQPTFQVSPSQQQVAQQQGVELPPPPPPPQQQQPLPLPPPPLPQQQQQQQQKPSRNRLPSGIPNPMYAKADFTLPQHPYQNYYVAPSHGFSAAQADTSLLYIM